MDKLGRLGSVTGNLVLDRFLAGPLPEAAARSIVEHQVLRRVTSELLASAENGARSASADEQKRTEELFRRALSNPAVERFVVAAVESKVAADLSERVIQSPEFHRLLKTVLASDQVRVAINQQATTFADELGQSLRARAVRLDSSTEAGVRGWFRHARRDEGRPIAQPGIASRGAAFVTDAAIIQLVYVVGAGMVGLVASLFGGLRPEWLVATIAGGTWAIFVATYFILFWSTTGQTPGLRLMRLRVVDALGRPPSSSRSLLRLLGLAVAIVLVFAGFLPMFFDRSRRAFQDFVAGTSVVTVLGD